MPGRVDQRPDGGAEGVPQDPPDPGRVEAALRSRVTGRISCCLPGRGRLRRGLGREFQVDRATVGTVLLAEPWTNTATRSLTAREKRNHLSHGSLAGALSRLACAHRPSRTAAGLQLSITGRDRVRARRPSRVTTELHGRPREHGKGPLTIPLEQQLEIETALGKQRQPEPCCCRAGARCQGRRRVAQGAQIPPLLEGPKALLP